MRLLRIDHVAGQDHLQRAALPDEPRQTDGAAVSGDDSELDFRQPELRVLAREPDVAGERELQAAAEREAVHGSDHRLRHLLEEAERVLALA